VQLRYRAWNAPSCYPHIALWCVARTKQRALEAHGGADEGVRYTVREEPLEE